MRIHTANLTGWKLAQKTHPPEAKRAEDLADPAIFESLLLKTREGNEPVAAGNVVCRGIKGELWQQRAERLFKRYDIVGLSPEGWLHCEPKNGTECRCLEITQARQTEAESGPKKGDFFVIGLFGEESAEGPRQWGKWGDFVCQDPKDPEDNWVVDRAIFLRTYRISEKQPT